MDGALIPSAADDPGWDDGYGETCWAQGRSFNIHDGLDAPGDDLQRAGRLSSAPRARRISRRMPRLAPVEGIAAD